MFALESSIDGKSFKQVFVSHRLRKYETLSNAVNGAVHFIKSLSFKGNIIRIYDVDTKEPQAFVRRLSDNKHSLEYCETSSTPKPSKEPINKEPKSDTKESINKVPIESLIDTKEARINFLMERYKKYQEKKASKKKDIIAKEPINKELSLVQVTKSFIDTFNTKVIELAIKMNDYKTLFYTEMRLLKMGYVWYPDEDNNIKLKPMNEAIASIGK